jgi:methyl-accepting chemotaxis protein WspA
MRNLTIRRRILASFAIVLALMATMAAIAYSRLMSIERQAEFIERDAIPGVTFTNQIVVDRIANYALTQEFALHTDMVSKRKSQTAIMANRAHLDTLTGKYAAIITVPTERELFESYKSAVVLYRAMQDDVLQSGLDANANRDEVVRKISVELYPEFARTQAAATVLVDYNKAEVVASTDKIVSAAAGAKLVVLLTVGVALAVAFACGYFLLRAISLPLGRLVTVLDTMRTGNLSGRLHVDRGDEFGIVATGFNRMSEELASLVGQVQQSGVQVNTSVNEIAATAKQQQATASEIAATTIEIGATSREISATSKELVRTMTEVSSVAEHAATLAGDGKVGLTRMEGTMRHVMEAAGSINAKLAVLNERAGNINQVVTTITRVADQTNLLSLNAAIEAEKAGEYGRGFAVVATEIRRLADQTAVATFDIEQMVKEIQSAVSAGVMGMDKFSEEVRRGMQDIQQIGGQLSEIIHEVQALAPRCEAVNEGMQAQSTGAEQITQALGQLSEAARQTVDSLRQSSQAIDSLNHAVSGMRNGVSRFKVAA